MKIAKDIAKGCAYLHGSVPPIVHRDLKSPNILLLTTAEEATGTIAKVADFGTSQYMEGMGSGKKVDNPVWLAPEVIRNEKYTEKADVYSFGVILWEMVAQNRYFMEERFWASLEKEVLAGQRPDIPSTCFPEVAELISECWHQSYASRPSFSHVVIKMDEILTRYYPDEATYDS